MFSVRKSILGIGLLFAIGLNILTVTNQLVFDALSGLAESALAFVPSVKAKTSMPATNIRSLKADKVRLNSDLAKSRNTITSLNTEKNTLKTRLTKTQANLSAAKKKIPTPAVREKLQRTISKIAKRTARNVSVSATSSFAEAVPYLGVAAIVASLSMDVVDGCHTLKDLDEIGESLGLRVMWMLIKAKFAVWRCRPKMS